MSNYTKTTNFATKDSLPSGNANKIVKGTEIDTEFNNIATAVATKADTAGPTFTGTVTIPTADINGGAVDGTTIGASSASSIVGTTIVANTSISIAGDGATVTGIKDEDDMSSNSATKLATQQSIKAYVDSQVTAQDLDVTDGSSSIDIDLDSESLGILGGTGIDSTASGTGVTLAIDSTVTTLTGSQTLTNKTLTAPTLTGTTVVASLDISGDVDVDGTLETDALSINGTTVTSTAAELNILDGVTSTAAELNILDGVTSTTAELNILDGVTSTTAELNILDGKAFLDEDDMSSNSATGIASQQSIKAYVDAQITAEDLDFQADSGGALSIDLDSETLTFTGGTGIDTSGSGNAVTFAIDSTVATLTGSQTLTNKSLTAPTLTGTAVVASLDISGDIDVDGTTNLDVVDIDGAVDMASTLQVDGAITSSAGATITLADNTDNLTLISTDTDDNSGPNLRMYRNSSSPGDNYVLGQIDFEGKNDATQDVRYGFISAKISDASDGTEDGQLRFFTIANGTETQTMTLESGNATFSGSVTADGLDVELADNASSPVTMQQGGNSYFKIVTTNSSESVQLGNTTTNPDILLGGGNVGIGTSNPSNKLDIKGTVGFEATNSTNKWLAYTYTDNTFRLNYNGAGADEVVLSSSGNVGIGKTAGAVRIDVETNQNGNLAGQFKNTHATGSYGIKVMGGHDATNYSAVFTDKDNNTLMYIRGDGRVGIGTTTPANPLVVKDGTNVDMEFLSETNGVGIQSYNRTSSAYGYIRFNSATSGGETARMDTSGNFLVGTSNAGANHASDGAYITSNGQLIGRASGIVSYLNRRGSDGQILQFMKDGSSVGSIGSEGGDALYIQSGTTSGTGLLFTSNGTAIRPARNGATVDATLDLGSDSRRFKDLYLSGGAYLGGPVGIGTSAPTFTLDVVGGVSTNGSAVRNMMVFDTSTASQNCGGGITFGGNTNGTGGAVNDFATIQGVKENGTAGNYDTALRFSTRLNNASPVEHMRIKSSGYTVFGDGDLTTAMDSSGTVSDDQNKFGFSIKNTITSGSPYGLLVHYTGIDKNDASHEFITCIGINTLRHEVRSNGGIANFQSNNANLCDEREKKNIEATASQWALVKGFDIKQFHYNDESDSDAKRLGVIAQEVEAYAPDLITDWQKQKARDEVLWEESEDLPEGVAAGDVKEEALEEVLRKGVKEQQMMWMAIKALQEAQTRIETLEAEVAALKGA